MQNLKTISEKVFIGMNDKYPSHLLPSGVFSLIQNAIVDSGNIRKRNGTTATASALGAHPILGIDSYQPVAGTKYLFACLDGSSNAQLYYWTGTGNWTALGSANIAPGQSMNFVQASNILFGFNGTDVVTVDASLTYTKDPATVPLGKVAAWFHNYLFVGGTATNPNRLYFSNLGNPTVFSPSDFVDINPNDGDEITGMTVFNDQLYVFKNNTIWSISGFSGSTFSATTAAGQNTNSQIFGYGTPSHQSIVVTGKDMYYLSFSGGIPHFRSFVQTSFATSLEHGVVSWDVEGTMEGLSKAHMSAVAGIYDGKFVYWSVPDGASSSNNLILAFHPEVTRKSPYGIMRSWVKWTGINASQFALSDLSGQETIYYGDATTGGNVFRLNDPSVFTDNGVAVVMDVRSRDFQLGQSIKSKWKYIYFRFNTGSAGSLHLNARIDQAVDFTNQDIIALVGNSPGFGSFIFGTSVFGGQAVTTHRTTFAALTGHLLGIQFTESTSNACIVYDFEIMGLPKGLRAT